MRERPAELRLFEAPTALRAFGGSRGPGAFADEGTLAALRRAGYAVSSERVDPRARGASEIDDIVALNRALAERVRQAVDRGAAPLALLGDCTACLGVLAGLARPVAIVWLDAHGDFNTPETTVTGFLGGMPLAAAVGRCWQDACASLPGFVPAREDHVILVARSLDPAEADLLRGSQVRLVDEASIRRRGLGAALTEALSTLPQRAEVYLHLDLDVLDPALARANRYAEPGGMTPEDVLEALRIVGERASVRAAAVSAYDPSYDSNGRALAAGRDAVRVLAGVMRGSR